MAIAAAAIADKPFAGGPSAVTAPLRSTQFYEGTPPVVGGVNTWTTVYTVPTGHRITLKQILMSNQGTTHSGGVRLNAAFVIRQLSLTGVGTAGANDLFFPWMVLNPGETLQVLQVVAASIAYNLSGYLLYI